LKPEEAQYAILHPVHTYIFSALVVALEAHFNSGNTLFTAEEIREIKKYSQISTADYHIRIPLNQEV
jgi:hypothetical protein